MKIKKILPIIILIAVIGIFITPSITGNAVIIKQGDSVSLEYTGTLSDGTVFDTSVGRGPLTFTAGAGQMIQGFDQAVMGMQVGEEKTFTLQASEAYGEAIPEYIISMNRTEIELTTGQELEIGMQLQASNGMVVTITDLNEENATIDFNHPLAGKELTFNIKILSIN